MTTTAEQYRVSFARWQEQGGRDTLAGTPQGSPIPQGPADPPTRPMQHAARQV